MIKTVIHYVIALSIIFLCLFLGNKAQQFLAISIPGSILGMLLLFALLASGIIKVEWLRPGATLFIRHMMFLFVPISVGLMTHFDTLLANALPILASVLGGSVIVMLVMSITLDRLLKKKGE
ncbi:CidA/LrgA family protein [Vibrio sp.]|uniref:CidA/LrgA family protein n=1 Tax=Vibrio viridaestus TaxID=2487322 RepID=A0A3N9TD05_9VIBR|nr:CidA/LrgA family protein [Vibrio viridaestus]MDC0612245.1 CidA/LrgA family protein [Vibrio sp.]RQW61930.1 CidA/LrgA family protein [Vibrio viridaestus]